MTPPSPRKVAADLAVLGGAPQFDAPLHVGAPNVGDRTALLRRIEAMLDRNWLSNDGPLVQEFETRLAALTGAPHVVATCNGTLALELMATAAELDGEVIVPAFTFVATAHAMRYRGLRPVFCDVQGDHLIDPGSVSALITERTSAVVGVHLWGNPCAVDELAAITRNAGVDLFFDAAHAFGCATARGAVGTFGRAEVFSFHATKFVNSFEGGAVATADDDLAARLRLLRNFGFAGYDRVEFLGTNAKMTEVCAAMGLVSLDHMPVVIERNRANLDAYRAGFDGLPGVRLVEPATEHHNFQYVVIEIDDAVAGLARDAIVDGLWAENVRARRYFAPGCHRSEPYATEQVPVPLPVTERLCDQVLVLPTGLAVTPATAATVAHLVGLLLETGAGSG